MVSVEVVLFRQAPHARRKGAGSRLICVRRMLWMQRSSPGNSENSLMLITPCLNPLGVVLLSLIKYRLHANAVVCKCQAILDMGAIAYTHEFDTWGTFCNIGGSNWRPRSRFHLRPRSCASSCAAATRFASTIGCLAVYYAHACQPQEQHHQEHLSSQKLPPMVQEQNGYMMQLTSRLLAGSVQHARSERVCNSTTPTFPV